MWNEEFACRGNKAGNVWSPEQLGSWCHECVEAADITE